MITSTIGRRYSKALMALALENNESPEELFDELSTFSQALTADPRLLQLMSNPNVLLGDRLKMIGKMLDRSGVRPIIRNFVHLLLQKGRIGYFPDIVREFRQKADRHAGVVRAAVTSARELSSQDTEKISAILQHRFGKKVVLYEKVDAGLIGGLVIKSGSLSFDGSIRSQLKDIQNQLLEEVSSS